MILEVPDQLNATQTNAPHLDNITKISQDTIETKQVPIPQDLLVRLRQENAEIEQFKKIANLELQVKELQFKNTILETYVKMGLKETDSFNINTGLAEVK